MKRTCFYMPVVLLLIPVTLLHAKGPTRKVVISGGKLARQIQITDATVLKDFNIWSGAGTRAGFGEAGDGSRALETFIVAKWSPVPAPPPQLDRYRVEFYADHHTDGLDYVVTYVYDPASHRGYIYLPGKGEADYSRNTFSIYRGVEGHWFEARKRWVDLATSLSTRSKTIPSTSP